MSIQSASLKSRFVRAASWALGGYAATQLLRLGSNLLLTRLLVPDMFGAMAVANVLIIGLFMFSEFGLGSVGIKSARGDEPEFLNTMWTLEIARGALVGLLALSASGLLVLLAKLHMLPVASAYADPRLPPVIAALAITALLMGLESPRKIWARRHLAIGMLTRLEIIAQVVTTVVMVAWAYVSPTLWALAMGPIAGSVVKTVLTHVALPGPPSALGWDRTSIHEIIDFGKWAFFSSALTFLMASGDRLLLGGMLDSRYLGFYSIAFTLATAMQTAVYAIAGQAILPALSEIARDRVEQLKETLYKIRRPIDMVCRFTAGAMFMLGEPIIRAMYDTRYAEAGWILSVLSLTLISTSAGTIDQCAVAVNRVRLMTALNGARCVVLFCCIPAGYAIHGVHGAIAGVAASALGNVLVTLWFQARLGLLDLRQELTSWQFLIYGLGAGAATRWAIGAVGGHA